MLTRVLRACFIVSATLGCTLFVYKAVVERNASYKVYGRYVLVQRSYNGFPNAATVDAIYSAKAYADTQAGRLVQVSEYTGAMNRLVLFRVGFCTLMSKKEAEIAEDIMNAIVAKFKEDSGVRVHEIECERSSVH